MFPNRTLPRVTLLTLSLLSACAAAGPASSPNASAGHTGALAAYLTGRHALAAADYDHAAAALLEALAANPDNPDLHNQAFIAALIAGRSEAAELARALADNPMARLYLGSLDAAAGRWRRAEQHFTSIPRQGPVQTVQPILVAWTRHGAGETDDALAILLASLGDQGTRGLAALHGALIAEAARRPQDADRFFQIAATDRTGPSLRVAYVLAGWHIRRNRPVEAEALLRSIREASADSAILLPHIQTRLNKPAVTDASAGLAEVFLALGTAIRSPGANDLALALLAMGLGLDPSDSAIRLAMSDIHAARQHTEAALRVLRRIDDDDPLSPLVRLRRATLLERLGQTEQAVAALRDLARDVPSSPIPDRYIGDVYRSKSRFRDAVLAYERAVGRVGTVTPADWILFYNRGVALDRDGRWEQAEPDFERALELAPEQPYALNYLAYSWTERGQNLQRARSMLERAVRLRPNDGAITDSLGWVLFRLGNVADAVRLLERAVELEPGDPIINGHLGDAYWAAGRRTEGVYQWRRALTMDPPAEEAAQLERKIRDGYAGPIKLGGNP